MRDILQLNKFLVFALFLLASPLIKGQNISLYRLKNNNISAYYQNGTYIPNNKFHVSFLQTYLNIETPLSLGDISESITTRDGYNVLSIPSLVSKIDGNFEISTFAESHILGGGFAIDPLKYISLRVSAVAETYLELDKRLLDIFAYGFGSSDQISSSRNSYTQGMTYMEIAGTYSQNIPDKKLTISGSLKYLMGLYYVEGRIPTFLMKNNNNTSLTLEIEDLSFIYTNVEADGADGDDGFGTPQGAGVGVDFAISWQTPKLSWINLPLDLSLAVKDIFSFISWSNSVKSIRSEKSTSSIDRAYISDILNNFKLDDITSSFKKIGEQIETKKETEDLNETTVLAPKVFFSADVTLLENHNVGLIYFANTGRLSIPIHQKIGLGYTFTTSGKMFSTSITPMLNISKNTTYYSTAMALNLNAGFFQMHLFSDAIEQLIALNLLQTASVGVGFSFNFGKLSSSGR